MPLDSTGYTETKADPYSLEALIAWMEKQPRRRRYDWFNIEIGLNGCVAAQYFHALGVNYGDDALGRARKLL